MRKKIAFVVADNFSYKIVALFISLILWLTILGRRDLVMAKNFEVELLLSPQYTLVEQSADSVKIKLSGPRASLKRFIENESTQTITIDLSDRTEGIYDVEVPVAKMDLPFGVKLISTKPSVIRVEIAKGKK